ncbi:hypothetical protein Sjap_011628 [Stephania japonica]|uniref:Uncharacterized protein n=1 Tax=Stephania japonica TaxID=461633 RepID=A0AAP0P887_9MAGN
MNTNTKKTSGCAINTAKVNLGSVARVIPYSKDPIDRLFDGFEGVFLQNVTRTVFPNGCAARAEIYSTAINTADVAS